jgi:hypothetical protein
MTGRGVLLLICMGIVLIAARAAGMEAVLVYRVDHALAFRKIR